MTERNYYLKIIKGYEEGKVIPLTENEMTLGRADENDIVIRVAEVSRRHAILTRQEDRYLIRDLGSTNGTFVDRKRIGGKYLLEPGDTIMLGDAVYLTFDVEADRVDSLEDTPPSPMEVPQPPPPPPQPPVEEKVAASETQPPQPPAQAEAISEGDEEEVSEPDDEEGGNTWLWAGIGCLVVLIFFAVVGLIAFDYLNLYCTPPFDSLFSFLYTCTP